SPPSTAIVCASLKRPTPFTHWTPFALNRLATPCVICLTTALFHSFAFARSSRGAPTSTPSFANVSSASFSAYAVCTHAFVGMQPTRRQVPPSAATSTSTRVMLDEGLRDLRTQHDQSSATIVHVPPVSATFSKPARS